MVKVFECQKCGARHLSSYWEDKTFNFCNTIAENSQIYYCPTCEQPSALEDIDLMSNLFEKKFWPYYLDKNQVIDQYPEMTKWL